MGNAVKLGMLGTIILLASCGSKTIDSDAENPAHCVAAFDWARSIELRDPPNVRGALAASGAMLYEMAKLRKSGKTDAGQGEAAEFMKAHIADGAYMQKVLEQCDIVAKRDELFRNLNSTGRLVKMGKEVDSYCAGNHRCDNY